ncbi:MAG: hypothetical protein ACM3UO_00205 [Bacillota bacterium]
MGSFTENLAMLAEEIGDHATITVEVNQVYAHYQEVHAEFVHPGGGQAFYLRDSVVGKAYEWMERLAGYIITPNGTDIDNGLIDVSEAIVNSVADLAPVEWHNLKSSGHPTVEKDGVTIYDRPPLSPRLTEAELKALNKHRDPLRYAYEPSQIKWRTDPAYKWGAILRAEGKRP